MQATVPIYQSPEQYQGENTIAIQPSTQKQKRQWQEALPSLLNIQSLYVFFSMNQAFFDVFCTLNHLTNIHIQTTTNSLIGIENLTHVHSLSLSDSAKLTDIEPLGKMTWLKELTIALPKISDYAPLATLINLEALNLDGGMDRYQKLDNIHFVKNMKKLKSLSLTSTRMTDTNFDAMTHLTALETLDISYNYPTEEFEKLRILPNLKHCAPLN